MKNSDKMKLGERFESQMGAFKAKRAKIAADLAAELAHLREVYPADLVNERLGNSPLNLQNVPITSTIVTTLAPKAKTADPSPVATSAAPVSKKRAAKKVDNTLSFSELRDQLPSVTTVFGEKEFTRKDIEAELKKRSLVFNPNHIAMILRKQITGITVRGSTPRNGQMAPLNVYQVTGPVAVVTEKRTRTQRTAAA